MFNDFNPTTDQYITHTPPQSVTLDPIVEKLTADNHSALMSCWFAAISNSLSAIENLTCNNHIKTIDGIDFYYHVDDLLAISQQVTHNGKTVN